MLSDIERLGEALAHWKKIAAMYEVEVGNTKAKIQALKEEIEGLKEEAARPAGGHH